MKKNNTCYIIRNIAIIILLCLSAISGEAADFDDIVSSLLGGDRQLELSRRQAAAESEALKASNTLSDPEAEFEFLSTGKGDRKYEFSVSQSIDWPGVYGARNRQIRLEQEGLRIDNELAVNEQRMKLRGLLVDIIAVNKVIAQLSTAADGWSELLETLETAYRRGDVTVIDVNKMRIEATDFKMKLSEAKRLKEELISELLLMSENAGEHAERCGSIAEFPLIEFESLEQYMAKAKAADASLHLARNRALVAKARREVATKSTLPGFSAGYRLSHEDGELFNGFAVGISVPLWRASKERRVAASEEVAAIFGERVEEIKIEKRVDASYRKATDLKDAIAEYGKALAASDNAGLLRRAYDAGAITLTEFVFDMNYFVDANVQYIELQRQYYKMLVELSRYDDMTVD